MKSIYTALAWRWKPNIRLGKAVYLTATQQQLGIRWGFWDIWFSIWFKQSVYNKQGNRKCVS